MKTIEEREVIYRAALETYGIQQTMMTMLQELGKMVMTTIRFMRRAASSDDVTAQVAVMSNLFGQVTFYFGNRYDMERRRDEMLDTLKQRTETAKSRGGMRVYASRYSDSAR